MPGSVSVFQKIQALDNYGKRIGRDLYPGISAAVGLSFS